AAVEPGDGALDNPTAGEHHKSFGLIGALDDGSFERRQDSRERLMEFRSLIAAVGKQLLQERIHPEQSGKKQDTAVAILDIGGGNDGVGQQTQCIYKKVALLAFDLLARIKAMRIDTGPPFSALLTLWLSMWGWLRVCLAHGTPHKARDECDRACRRSSTSRDSRAPCCVGVGFWGSPATGIPCSKHT